MFFISLFNTDKHDQCLMECFLKLVPDANGRDRHAKPKASLNSRNVNSNFVLCGSPSSRFYSYVTPKLFATIRDLNETVFTH